MISVTLVVENGSTYLSTQAGTSTDKNQGNLQKLLIFYMEDHLENRHRNSYALTHWGGATHIWVNKLTIIGSDNGLSPGQDQAIIWTSAGILSIGTLGTNFSEIHTFSFKKMYLKMWSGKCWPFCLSLSVLSMAYWIVCWYLIQFVFYLLIVK